MLIELLAVGIGTTALFYLKDRYGCKNSRSYGQETKMSYKMIRDIYHLNKSRWKYSKILAPGYNTVAGGSKVLLYNANKNGKWPDILDYGGGSLHQNIIRVHVSFPTWLLIKFSAVFKNVPTTGTEMILESAQRDIDKLKEKANAELEEANRQMLLVRSNLKKEKEVMLDV